jgi:hypothetical protein
MDGARLPLVSDGGARPRLLLVTTALYCSKDGKITKYGFPAEIKIIQNLYPYQKEIEDLCINTEPDGRTCHWYWENNGNVGKSSFCMDECRTIIIDIPRANQGHVSYNAIECILNGMITNTKYETGVKVFNPPHVICFANFPSSSFFSLL